MSSYFSADSNSKINQKLPRSRRVVFRVVCSLAALISGAIPLACSSSASSTTNTVDAENESGGTAGDVRNSTGAGAGGHGNDAGSGGEAGSDAGNGQAGGSAGQDGDAGSAGESNAAGTSGNGSAGAAGNDAGGCAAETVNDSIGIFVESSLGSDVATCGDRERPCKTIQQGVDRAAVLGKSHVYVSAGTYVESVQLKSGIRVEGAWGAVNKTWSRICTPQANQQVVIQAPISANRTIVADALGGKAELARVTVRSKKPAAAGESLYGVFVRNTNTTLVLDAVSVEVADAGSGSEGTKGANAAAAFGACSAGSGATATTDGAIGDGAVAGMFTENGYVATEGGKGKPGTRGENGRLDARECVSCKTCGGRTCLATADGQSCGTAGEAGCGGNVPEGGNGGKGGGSSVAVYVWDATLIVTDSSLASGNAGNGRKGGPSGDRGIGSPGKSGDNGKACATSCESENTGEQCCTGDCLPQFAPAPDTKAPRDEPNLPGADASELMSTPQPLALPCSCRPCPALCIGVPSTPSGGKGYQGGSSSLSGEGGGGSGGSSYAIFKNAKAKVSQNNSTLSAGKAGVGAGNGANGKAGLTN